MILRQCKLPEKQSFFLFGPRGCGKSTLLQALFSPTDTLFVDLLDVGLADELMLDLGRFERLIDAADARGKRVAIDEIQKFPRLLDVVQRQIQRNNRQFVMTGSSARRLKQASANMLAGRAWVYHLFPFTSGELVEHFDLKRALEWGTLPDAYLAQGPQAAREYLSAYVSTYIEKEIQQEQWVRKLEPFRRFLAIAAQMNGKIVNRSAIAREAGVNDVTVATYFEILEDTLLGFEIPAFHRSIRKAQRQAPKFYFVDTGVKRALDRTLPIELLPQTNAWGEAFEHWVILELRRRASYARADWQFSYLRTKDDLEIDLILDRPGRPRALVEIKSKARVSAADAKALESLGPDLDAKAERYLLSCDPSEATFGTTRALPWQRGIEALLEEGR